MAAVGYLSGMTSDTAGGTGSRQFDVNTAVGAGHLLDLAFLALVAANAIDVVGFFVVSDHLGFIDPIGFRYPGHRIQIVAPGGPATGDGCRTFPGMMAHVASHGEMDAMRKLHGNPFSLHRFWRF